MGLHVLFAAYQGARWCDGTHLLVFAAAERTFLTVEKIVCKGVCSAGVESIRVCVLGRAEARLFECVCACVHKLCVNVQTCSLSVSSFIPAL